jgi:hypothetical protein
MNLKEKENLHLPFNSGILPISPIIPSPENKHPIFSFIYLFIHSYIIWVISPLFPLAPSLSLQPLASRQKLFCPFL